MAESGSVSKAAFLKSMKTHSGNKYNEVAKKAEPKTSGFSNLPAGLTNSPQMIVGGKMDFTAKEKGSKPRYSLQFVSKDESCPGIKWSKFWVIEDKKDPKTKTVQKTKDQVMDRFVSDLLLMGVEQDDITGDTEEEALSKLIDAFTALTKSKKVIAFNTSKIQGSDFIVTNIQGEFETEDDEESDDGEEEAAEDEESSDEAAEDETEEIADEESEDGEEEEESSLPEKDDVVYKGKTKGVVKSVNEKKGTVVVLVGEKGKPKKEMTWKLDEIAAEPS